MASAESWESADRPASLRGAGEPKRKAGGRKRPAKGQGEAALVPAKKVKQSPEQEPVLEDFSTSPGGFMKFIVPLIKSGGEKKLNDWLLRSQLLKRPNQCYTAGCQGRRFDLVESHLLWKCVECEHSFCIRTKSFFDGLSSSAGDIISCVLAWSNCKSIDQTCRVLGIKKTIVVCIYQRIFDTIINYLEKDFSKKWVLGGPGTVAILDLWPNGFKYANSAQLLNQMKRKKYEDRHRVVLIADTNHVPVRYLARPLPQQKSSINMPKILLSPHLSSSANLKLEMKEETREPQNKVEEENGCEGNNLDKTSNSYICEDKHRNQEPRILKEQQELVNSNEDFKRKIESDLNYKLKNKKKTVARKFLHPECDRQEKAPKLHETVRNEETEMQDENDEREQTNQIQRNNKRENIETFQTDCENRNHPENVEDWCEPHSKYQKKGSQVKREEKSKRQLLVNQAIEYMRTKEASDAALSLAFDYISPGTLVVVNDEVFPYAIDPLRESGLYTTVQSVCDLMTADKAQGQLTTRILENIWKDAADFCKTLVPKTYPVANNMVAEFQWRLKFRSAPAYHILSIIASHYNPAPKKR